MKRLFSLVMLGSGILLVSASAQGWSQDPYYRDNPRYREGYSEPGYRYGYGYDRNEQMLINRVISDLDRAARAAYLDRHEAKHFDEVARSLQEFQSRWSRGKFDIGKLDHAIHNLEHLTEADRVRGRDRDMLTRDLYELREFRANRGRW